MPSGTVEIISRYPRPGVISTQMTVGAVSVRDYATSTIMQEIGSGRTKSGDIALIINESAQSITLEHTGGYRRGRRYIFKPILGEEAAWDDLLTFVRAIHTIWNAGYRVV